VTFIALFRQRSQSSFERLFEEFALAVPPWFACNFAQPYFGNEPSVRCGKEQDVLLNRRRQMQKDHDLLVSLA
jgi:hypothetical protein